MKLRGEAIGRGILELVIPPRFHGEEVRHMAHFNATGGGTAVNEAMSGREMRILDLKHEVNELLGQTGQPPRYPSAESQDQPEE